MRTMRACTKCHARYLRERGDEIMPICIPKDLPAAKTLQEENILSWMSNGQPVRISVRAHFGIKPDANQDRHRDQLARLLGNTNRRRLIWSF